MSEFEFRTIEEQRFGFSLRATYDRMDAFADGKPDIPASFSAKVARGRAALARALERNFVVDLPSCMAGPTEESDD